MSIRAGDRAVYRGESVIIMGPAPFLGEAQWSVKIRDGSVRSGWRGMTAAESALSLVTRPAWEIGDSVLVGFTPYRRRGTVTAITTEAGRIRYNVTFAEDGNRFKTEEGTRWIQDAHDVVVGAEYLDTSN